MNWKILIADKLEASGLESLKQRAQVDDLAGISPAELLAVISDYEGVIVRSRTKLTAEVFAAGAQLKVAGRAGVGVDNIDLNAAASHGVIVVNAPTSTTLAVAEHTMALMLTLARKISRADAGLKRGDWLKKELQGSELAGKTLGIIGTGRIGTQVAARAAAFGMTTIGYDALISDEEIRQRGLEPVPLEELYSRSDFISLHLPLTPDSRNMIDGQVLARMKPGVRLVCAARGGVIDETALTAALESGQVAGAALDVFAQEPPGLSALVGHPNVIGTPHIAAQTLEAQIRTAADIGEEVLAALGDKQLRWRIV